MKSRVKKLASCLSVLALTACTAGEGRGIGPAARSVVTGPAADYPVVVGEVFTIEGIEYEPVDRLNYDEVGFASVDKSGATGVTVAHKTLPLPSYVEITALDTGRTILARVERRGPMTDRLVELSSEAVTQLGVLDAAPIRVRRVLPPEVQRAELRSDRAAPLRMDTPEGLLAVLRQRLPTVASAMTPDPEQGQISSVVPQTQKWISVDPDEAAISISETAGGTSLAADVATVANPPLADAPLPPEPAEPAALGGYFVQLGTFSAKSNAEALAEQVEGFLVQSGKFTLVRTGPYSSRGQADAALAKLREQGYTDALLRNSD